MTVSKRTRFEVLRRDNFVCRYCRTTDGKLTVDHVTPVALGGSDDPTNLVAACVDCNAGKSSTSPDEHAVAEASADEIRWSAALAKASEIDAARAATAQQLVDWFFDEWDSAMPHADLPGYEWPETIVRFSALGLSNDTILEAVQITAGKAQVAQHSRFKYFCGVCWAKVRELQEMARQILAAEPSGEV